MHRILAAGAWSHDAPSQGHAPLGRRLARPAIAAARRGARCHGEICGLEKYRTDPARDALRMNELRPQEQRLWRQIATRKGVSDPRLNELRWLIEELRVSFFAQELRTPQPVSIKRLDKVWALLER